MSDSMQTLLQLMQQLREPKTGCPWDIKQTFESIIPHTIEEAYELADAIFAGNAAEIKDELGDLLFQVVFYAQLGAEQGNFDFEDVVEAISSKLVRRHPHVFLPDYVQPNEDLSHQWEAIKQTERDKAGKAQDSSILANIPSGMTPLLKALKLQKRCAKVGFDWSAIPPVVDKIHEEINEVLAEINTPQPNQAAVEEEIGDLLFAVVNLARHTQVSPETALIKANQKFEQRFRQVEQIISAQHLTPETATLTDMETAWQQVKQK